MYLFVYTPKKKLAKRPLLSPKGRLSCFPYCSPSNSRFRLDRNGLKALFLSRQRLLCLSSRARIMRGKGGLTITNLMLDITNLMLQLGLSITNLMFSITNPIVCDI